MTLTQIQYFLEVCKTMNFTKAAQNLFVAQPSLSRQIQLLETELGVPLMIRTNRKVILTDAGKVFEKEFGRIEGEIGAAVYKIKEAGSAKKEIRVGLFFGLTHKVVHGLVQNLKEWFPGYKIYVNKYSSYNLKLAFELDNVDMVVTLEGAVVGQMTVNSCQVEKLPAFLVYAPELFHKEGGLALSDFDGKNFVCVRDGEADGLVERQKDIVQALGIHPGETVQTDNMLGTLMYIENRTGFSVFFNDRPEGMIALPLPEDLAWFDLSAYWKQDSRFPLNDFFQENYGAAAAGEK